MTTEELVRQAVEEAARQAGVELVLDEHHLGSDCPGDSGFTRVLVTRDFVQRPAFWYRVSESLTLSLNSLGNFEPTGATGTEEADPCPSLYGLSDLRPFIADVARGMASVRDGMPKAD